MTCAPSDAGVEVSSASEQGYQGNRFTWLDASGEQRSALMVDNRSKDPAGFWGGYMRRMTYVANGDQRECIGRRSSHPGFGMVVNHYGSTSMASHRAQGSTFTMPLDGPHHAIQAYTWRYPVDGHDVDITVHWLFAAGRDHPVYAITYDLSDAPANAVKADTRAPYGDLEWTGAASAPPVEGLGWGDRYRFRTLQSPVTMGSGWDYSSPNVVPHVVEWASSHDAEMGLVQTQSQTQKAAGGYGFFTAWGTQDSNGPMPVEWNWPFQLNQYDLASTTTSKRMAWGSNYGAVGQTAYDVYGNDGKDSGYPYQSYSVHVVLGTHAGSAVQGQITQVERALESSITATLGTPRLSGPAGVGRTDPITYEPAGYNPVYGTWELDAETQQGGSAVDFTLTPKGVLERPLIVVHGWTGAAPCGITIDEEHVCGGFFASVDAGTLWLTLDRNISAPTRVQLSTGAACQ